jgi:hypothetical protein
MATRPPPTPPRPGLVRSPTGSFGWLDDRFLHEGWLAQLEPPAIAVLTLLALAADRHGASYYGRARMAERLGMAFTQVEAALKRLRELGLVDHRPWRHGDLDGVWQLLPLPERIESPRGTPAAPIGDILANLGIRRRPQAKPPDLRGS